MKEIINHPPQTAVYGESLIDMRQTDAGTFQGTPGGSPYNVARALGLQNIPVSYVSPLSADLLGQALRARLNQAGVKASAPVSQLPTSLALVVIDENKKSHYSLYRQGVADRDIGIEDLTNCIPENLVIFHCGSLVLIPEEIDQTVYFLELLQQASSPPVVCLDLNVRPQVVNNDREYQEAILQAIPKASVVKLSDEDLAILPFGLDPVEASESIASMTKNGVAIITLGFKGSLIRTRHGYWHEAPPLSVEVVDTIGAGDCFQGGMIAWLYDNGIHSDADLANMDENNWRQCLHHASLSAAFSVRYAGCQPATPADLKEMVATRYS